jgi:acetyl-CoA acetyltransferase
VTGLRRHTAIVGLGTTPYYRRGASLPRTPAQLAADAILAAVADAGLDVDDIDGFASFAGGQDTALLAQWLGVPEVRFSASIDGGGGGSAASVGLAAAAVEAGMADCVVAYVAVQQAASRFGAAFAPNGSGGGYLAPPSAETDFMQIAGLMAPGHMFAVLASRHMHRYGTTREHLAEVAVSTRANATRRPTALRRASLTVEEYLASPMIADPLCRLDFCLESDGAAAVVVVSTDRARDLAHRPILVLGSAHGGLGRWGQAITWMGMPDEYFASSGHRPVARRVFEQAAIVPGDVDVALLYDHFTPMVLMQLEDYGFCGIGESGDFVASGAIRWPDGSLPTNTHGGNLSEAYLIGMTHVVEAVEQLRGAAVNQVEGAELALVTGGPAPIPVSNLVLGRA